MLAHVCNSFFNYDIYFLRVIKKRINLLLHKVISLSSSLNFVSKST